MTNDYFKQCSATGESYAGDHLLLDLHGGIGLDDAGFIQRVIEEAARSAGATIICSNYYSFGKGAGISGMTLLAESHISIHTWPERGFAAIDIFMCGASDPQEAAKYLRTVFRATGHKITPVRRGEILG